MRKMALLAAAAVVLLCISDAATAGGCFEMQFVMVKDVESGGATYGLEFECESCDRPINKLRLKTPKKNWSMPNPFGLNELVFASRGLSYQDFKKKFPAGKYRAIASLSNPTGKEKINVNLTHNFPATPAITYPTDGATGVSVTPTIQWNAVGAVDMLEILIRGDEVELTIELPTGDTSYAVGQNVLQPNTQYELWVDVTNLVTGGGQILTGRRIEFTTGP